MSDKWRIELLELALLEYVERYGVTDQAKLALGDKAINSTDLRDTPLAACSSRGTIAVLGEIADVFGRPLRQSSVVKLVLMR
jgi:hypothetical protein